MSPMYLFIIAIVFPSGEVQVKHTIVPECPTQAEVVAVMKPMKDKGEIIAWGGNCSSLVPERKA